MPAINGLSVAQTRLANASFAATFFPRMMRSVWPRLCGMVKSGAQVEPFTFLGAAPLVRQFNGSMNSQTLASYTVQVPNYLWKNIEIWKRDQFEFDQTRVLPARVGQLGVKVAQHWDYLLATRMLKGDQAGSQNMTFNGVSYTTTLDSQPLFSASHNTGGTSTFSNIITGHLPTTIAALNAQDLTVTANQIQLDISALIQNIATYTDDKGALIYPDFDPARQLIVVAPACLQAGMELALRTQGTLGGSNGSSSGSTTNIGYRMVKDVIIWNLLTNCPDVTVQNPTLLTPTFATQYYVYIDGDFIRPWQFQRFVPVKQSDVIGDYDVEAEVERILKSALENGLTVRPEDAEVYAATEIDHNLGALGANAQESVVMKEEFFCSGRTRGNIFPGAWFTAAKIDPTGSST